jgi:hypothetical protein
MRLEFLLKTTFLLMYGSFCCFSKHDNTRTMSLLVSSQSIVSLVDGLLLCLSKDVSGNYMRPGSLLKTTCIPVHGSSVPLELYKNSMHESPVSFSKTVVLHATAVCFAFQRC